MTSNGLRLDAYVRVSQVRGRGGPSFISPEVQREQIERWAKAHGHSLTWHAPELDVSGGSMSRPIFDQIVGRIRSGQSDGVIVAKLDRFARTLVGALSTLEEFGRHGAVLVSVAENLDLSTPMGKAFLRILLVFAELERDRIAENWGTATHNAIARGVHITKFTPFGYDRAPDKRLVPNADAPAVREIFLMRGAHKTRTDIARRLDEIAQRPNGGRWITSSVERILKNRVYLGEAYRGETVNPDAHEAIVTFAEWQAANLAPVRSSHRGKRPNLLGGIVRCAACRYVLAPQVYGGGRPNPTRVYRCREVHSAGSCPAPASISREAVERYVETVWREQMAEQALSIKQDSQALKAATAELEAAEDELRAFASDLTARRLLASGYHAALEARATAVNRAQAQLQQVSGPALDTDAIARYDELPIEDRKRIIGSSIDAVIVRRDDGQSSITDRVTILWRGEGPDDLPRRGRDNGPVRAYAS
ncbi:MAG TPA: recombinase family protein [Solirubrobacteraceae bacterium]|nr:recombinase family protein [Solirubrobacteraceae bacterium]